MNITTNGLSSWDCSSLVNWAAEKIGTVISDPRCFSGWQLSDRNKCLQHTKLEKADKLFDRKHGYARPAVSDSRFPYVADSSIGGTGYSGFLGGNLIKVGGGNKLTSLTL